MSAAVWWDFKLLSCLLESLISKGIFHKFPWLLNFFLSKIQTQQTAPIAGIYNAFGGIECIETDMQCIHFLNRKRMFSDIK